MYIGNVCVGCGERYPIGVSHKCDPKKIARIESARKGAVGRKEYRSFNQRLREGFAVLSIRENQDE